MYGVYSLQFKDISSAPLVNVCEVNGSILVPLWVLNKRHQSRKLCAIFISHEKIDGPFSYKDSINYYTTR